MLIGFLILVTLSLILCAWLLRCALWPMRSPRGQIRPVTRGRSWYLSLYAVPQNVCAMQPMARGDVTVQWVKRKGATDLYIAGQGGVSVVFYDLEELTDWLMNRGIPFEDPVWEQIDQLIGEQS